MAGKVTDFDALTTLADADVFYVVQTSDNTDKKITAANIKADFGSAQYTVETASDNKTITSTATNYMLIFTRQATAKTITLPEIGTAGRVIRINVTGSGAGNVSLAADDGETVGGFTATDWEWDGTGGLTLIDDGTNWQVLESGIWDSYDVTYDSIDYPQDKYTNGRIKMVGETRLASGTENAVYALLSPLLPNTDDVMRFSGWSINVGIVYRSDASTLTMNSINSATGTLLSYTFKADGSGTAVTTNMQLTWETINTVWTS